jgi:TolA-binding protein
MMAEVRVREGDYAGAVTFLRCVLDGKAPDDAKADAALRAGQIALRNMGDGKLAAQYFRYVEEAFGGTAQAMDAHDELLRLGIRQAET